MLRLLGLKGWCRFLLPGTGEPRLDLCRGLGLANSRPVNFKTNRVLVQMLLLLRLSGLGNYTRIIVCTL